MPDHEAEGARPGNPAARTNSLDFSERTIPRTIRAYHAQWVRKMAMMTLVSPVPRTPTKNMAKNESREGRKISQILMMTLSHRSSGKSGQRSGEGAEYHDEQQDDEYRADGYSGTEDQPESTSRPRWFRPHRCWALEAESFAARFTSSGSGSPSHGAERASPPTIRRRTREKRTIPFSSMAPNNSGHLPIGCGDR